MRNIILYSIFFYHFLYVSNLAAQQFKQYEFASLTQPFSYTGHFNYYDPDQKILTKVTAYDVKNDYNITKSFPNTVSNVTIYEVRNDGRLLLSALGISKKNTVYSVIYDFSLSQTVFLSYDSVSNQSKVALIGIGVRLIAKIKTSKSGIHLSSPYNLALNTDKLQGSLEVLLIGVNSPKIISLIPTSNDLTPSSIMTALQSISSIKSHLFDEDIVVIPQILAISLNDETTNEYTNFDISTMKPAGDVEYKVKKLDPNMLILKNKPK